MPACLKVLINYIYVGASRQGKVAPVEEKKARPLQPIIITKVSFISLWYEYSVVCIC